MSRSLLIYGAGGHGRVVADAARAAGFELIGWADGDPAKAGQEIDGAPVVAAEPVAAAAAAERHRAEVIVGVGNNRFRQETSILLARAGVQLATVVHPSAAVSHGAQIGAGTFIAAMVAVAPGARIGEGVIVNHGVTVDHDNRIGDFVHLSPGAHIGGTVVIGEGTHVGIGASVRNDLSIGAWSTVGAGAAVVSDLAEGITAVGVPARPRSEPSRDQP